MEWVIPSMESRETVGKIIHGINAPVIAGAVVVGVQDAVHHRVAHIQIGRGHIDLCPQHTGAVREFARRACARTGPDFPPPTGCDKGCPCPARSSVPRYSRISSGGQIADIGLPSLINCTAYSIELFKIIRGIIQPVLPIKSQPAHILLNGFHIFHLFFGRIGVVEAQIAEAAVFAQPGRNSGRWIWHGRYADSRWARAENGYALGPDICRFSSPHR